jgi:hypothetical protein
MLIIIPSESDINWKLSLFVIIFPFIVDQGERPELDAKIEALKNRLAEFHVTKIDEHGVVVSIYDDADALLGMALKKLMDMAPTKKLPPFQVELFIEESLQAMMAAHKEGDVYFWRPYEKIMTFLYPKSRIRNTLSKNT